MMMLWITKLLTFSIIQVLYVVLHLLQNNPDVLEKLQNDWTCLMLNPIQWTLLVNVSSNLVASIGIKRPSRISLERFHALRRKFRRNWAATQFNKIKFDEKNDQQLGRYREHLSLIGKWQKVKKQEIALVVLFIGQKFSVAE